MENAELLKEAKTPVRNAAEAWHDYGVGGESGWSKRKGAFSIVWKQFFSLRKKKKGRRGRGGSCRSARLGGIRRSSKNRRHRWQKEKKSVAQKQAGILAAGMSSCTRDI